MWFRSGPRSASESLARGAAALFLLVCTTGARVYLTEEEALSIAFPEAAEVTERAFELDDPARSGLAARLGYEPRERLVVVYEARGEKGLLGHALVMNEVGKRLPITFLVAILPDATVDQVLLLVFREPRGHEVESPLFRRQYRGRRLGDPIRRGRDIRNVSGATMSVDAMNRGVRRALVLWDRLVGGARHAPTPPQAAGTGTSAAE